MAEQQVRAQAERNYADRINALATTDPLLRLQMAGINPEIPGGGSPFGHHPGLSGFMRHPMPPPPPGGPLDTRLRAPGPADMLMRPPPPGVGYPSSMQHDMLTRHLMMEREQQMAVAAQQHHQHQILAAAQHEQFVRMDEENRARHAAAAAAQQQRP